MGVTEKQIICINCIFINSDTLERELAPLNAIKEHNPKYLLTMDYTPIISHNGIKQINAIDWLLNRYSLFILI